MQKDRGEMGNKRTEEGEIAEKYWEVGEKFV